MTHPRWREIEESFAAADRLEGEARGAFLAKLRRRDPELASEVESLLAADSSLGERILAQGVASASSDALGLEGRRLGPWLLDERLGSGGMGTVYRAERADGAFEQRVAIKLVRTGLDPSEAAPRFVAERQILARLQHPNIARLIDGGMTDDGVPWLAMEYVDGSPLLEWCDRQRLGVRARLALFLQVCDAVHDAHRHLVVHRDLKPSNVLVEARDDNTPRVKLLDFGIAKVLSEGGEELTREDRGPMTLAYAAPEQVRGDAVTTATDVHALGALLYELLCGERPFGAAADAELRRAILEETPVRPSVVVRRRARASDDAHTLPAAALLGDLDNICLEALRKEPQRRYASAAELAQDVKRHLERRPVLATPDSIGYRLGRAFARNRRLALTALAALLAVVALTISYTADLAQERDLARREATKASEVASFLTELFAISDPSESAGERVTARDLLDRGVQRIDEDLAGQPGVRGDLMHVMGDVHKRLGLYERALELLGEAERLRAEAFGEQSAERAESLHRLAEVLLYMGRREEAEPLFQRALAIRETLGASASGDVAETLDLLGRLERERLDLERARRYHERALQIRRERFAPDSLAVSESLQSLAMLAVAEGDADESARLFAEALAMREARLRVGHAETLELLHGLGFAQREQGRLVEAEATLGKTLDLVRRVYGESHQNVAFTLNSLGWVQHDLGDLRAAESSWREALDIWREGPPGDNLAVGLNNLARALAAREAWGEAEELTEEALAALIDTAEAPSPWRSAIELNRARILRGQGRLDEARAAAERALALDRRHDGARTAGGEELVELAEIHHAAGAYDEALAHYADAISIFRSGGGVPLARALTAQARTLTATGERTAAETALVEAISILETLAPAYAVDLAAARAGLARVSLARGDTARARELLGTAHAVMLAAFGEDHSRTQRLAALLRDAASH